MTNSELLLSKLNMLGQSANVTELVNYEDLEKVVDVISTLVDKLTSATTSDSETTSNQSNNVLKVDGETENVDANIVDSSEEKQEGEQND